MLKTVDVLIGATMVLLLFSMALTVITQTITNAGGRRGRYLKAGLANLLQQLGIPVRKTTEQIADSLLRHPMVTDKVGKLGSVIHRAEFTKLLLDMASDNGAKLLEDDCKKALNEMLENNGISQPAAVLKNVRAMALQIEASNPELSNHMRDGLAILHEASSDFVARVNSWFDQTVDRVGQRFSHNTLWITVVAAIFMVVTVQLDIIAVVDRLYMDDQFREALVKNAQSQASNPNASDSTMDMQRDPDGYNLISTSGLITLPIDRNWLKQLSDTRKYPGMVLSILLISLGAPFWYNILKDLLGLRSKLAQKDEAQRTERQTTQPADGGGAGTNASGVPGPAWLHGERGDLAAVG